VNIFHGEWDIGYGAQHMAVGKTRHTKFSDIWDDGVTTSSLRRPPSQELCAGASGVDCWYICWYC
jgi:hypothetical protein